MLVDLYPNRNPLVLKPAYSGGIICDAVECYLARVTFHNSNRPERALIRGTLLSVTDTKCKVMGSLTPMFTLPPLDRDIYESVSYRGDGFMLERGDIYVIYADLVCVTCNIIMAYGKVRTSGFERPARVSHRRLATQT